MKKFNLSIFMVLAAMALFSCKKDENLSGPSTRKPDPNIQTEETVSIVLNEEAITLGEGISETLYAITEPEDAEVAWESSNENVAVVESDGKVTAIKIGTAKITAWLIIDGQKEKSSQCEVTVIERQDDVTELKLVVEKTIKVDQQEILTCRVTPSWATLVWSSSNPKVVSVEPGGVIKGESIGTAVVTVRTVDGSLSKSCNVTVTGLNSGISYSQSWAVDANGSLKCGEVGTITINNPNNLELSITKQPKSTVAKASAINGGKIEITPVGEGETELTVKAAGNKRYNEGSVTIGIKVIKVVPEFTLSRTAWTLDEYSSAWLSIYTDYPDCEWYAYSSNEQVATVIVSGNRVSISTHMEGTATVGVRAKRTEKYEVSEDKTCKVTVKRYVDLSSSGTANCYNVTSAGFYKFKATVKGNSTESVGTIGNSRVLWESLHGTATPTVGDVVTGVLCYNGYIHFTSTGKEGNAVIAVNEYGSEKILWSWHIWATSKSFPTRTWNDKVVMGVNLGGSCQTSENYAANYHPFGGSDFYDSPGLYYQWGRKDPFPGVVSAFDKTRVKTTISWPSAVASSSSTGTINYATENPTTFITSDNNWSNERNYQGWTASGSNYKTKYDPCPPGWMVPVGVKGGPSKYEWENILKFTWQAWYEEYRAFLIYNYEIDFAYHGYDILPAVGYLSGRNGTSVNYFDDSAKAGYYWGSTVDASSDKACVMWSGDLGNAGTVYEEKVSGCSVRCFKE